MKKRKYMLWLCLLSASMLAACGSIGTKPGKNDLTPATPAASQVEEKDESMVDNEDVAQDNEDKKNQENGQVVEETASSTSAEKADNEQPEAQGAGEDEEPLELIAPQDEPGSESNAQEAAPQSTVDEDGNVAYAEENNVLPDDIDINDYIEEGAPPQEYAEMDASGIIDFDRLQSMMASFAAFAPGEAGSSMKVAPIVLELMRFANNIHASSLGEAIVSPAISSVMTRMMGFEKENIANNINAIKAVGDAFFSQDELTIGAFNDAGTYEAAMEETQKQGAVENWNALFEAISAAL